jgi:hypothetical protein
MTIGRRIGLAVALAAVLTSAPAVAQESARQAALELARLAVDDVARRRVDEQVTAGVVRAVGISLQERLSRRLLEVEWRMIAGIVERFVHETLPPKRTEEIAAEVYLRHFDEAELRELLAFQRSPAGRKLARLSPAIAADTTKLIEHELRSSPAMPDMLVELRRAFPVLGVGESP